MTTPVSQASTGLRWASRFGFLMAATGAAVGLGNLWRFPFQTGQNGGAAFVFLYLLCVVFIALPVLIAELAIGRGGRRAAPGAIRRVTGGGAMGTVWSAGGYVGAAASTLVLPIYSVIAGKIMAFSAMGFLGMLTEDALEGVGAPLYAGGLAPSVWTALFLGATIFIVARGLRSGVEAAVSVMMPLFFVMMAGLCVFALVTGDSAAALSYLLSPRFDLVTPQTVLAALGQALFSLAVGGAVIITYGAYVDDEARLAANAGLIAGCDTAVALVAGLMIFPVVFANGLDPAAGMGLIFDALPAAFSAMPLGPVIGGAFFALAFLAALTSSIAMLLMSVSISEDDFGWPRRRAVAVFSLAALILAMVSANHAGLSAALDFTVGSILLPIGALASSLIAGWGAPRDVMRAQLVDLPEGVFALWRFAVRYLCPLAIAAIFISGLAPAGH